MRCMDVTNFVYLKIDEATNGISICLDDEWQELSKKIQLMSESQKAELSKKVLASYHEAREEVYSSGTRIFDDWTDPFVVLTVSDEVFGVMPDEDHSFRTMITRTIKV